MPTLYLALAAVLGPLLVGGLTYTIQEWRLDQAVTTAVNAEKARAEDVCNGRIAQIGSASSADALAKIDAQKHALSTMSPTPWNGDGIKALCAREAAACVKPQS